MPFAGGQVDGGDDGGTVLSAPATAAECCQHDAAVTFYTVNGGGPTRPGGPVPAQGARGKASGQFNASAVIWQFFAST